MTAMDSQSWDEKSAVKQVVHCSCCILFSSQAAVHDGMRPVPSVVFYGTTEMGQGYSGRLSCGQCHGRPYPSLIKGFAVGAAKSFRGARLKLADIRLADF